MNRKGFTLIELLIVVLIIGILAAVALPQYQVTVDKSRYATLMPMAKSLATAQEGFFLTNSKYSQDLGSLDVELPNSPSGLQATLDNGIEVTLSDVKNYNYVKMKKEGLDNYYLLYQDKSYNYAGEQHCEALATSERANRLCKALGGRELEGNTTGGYKTYILEGDGNGTAREVPVPGECTVNAVAGCVRYSYMNGSGYEEFRQITSTYERNTHRDYDENGHFTHQQSVYDSGKVIDWDFNAEGYNIYQKTHNEDGQVVEIWKDDNGIRTHGKVELTNGSIEEAFWNPDGTYNHYTASWYDQDNDKVRFYNEYGSFNADGTQNSIQTKYWEDGSVRGYYPFLFNGSSNTDVGIGMEYNRDGSLATSVESGETGGYIAHYEYNSDGTYVRKPEETKDDSSTWTYGTYTTGTNGDVTRSDGVTISGSGNYPTLCQSHPDLPQCN